MTMGNTLSDRWKVDGKLPSGFDYMRVTLAVCVLLWHSAQLSYGTDFAIKLFKSPLGIVVQLILPMFFSLSGFLITSSLERTRRLSTFLTLRIIRIYPALLVEVLLSALILGPLVTTLSLREYFLSREFISYLANMTGYIHFRLPGVFLGNPVSGIVNTSLWTVPFELECYLALSMLFVVGFMRSRNTSVASFVLITTGLVLWMTLTHQSGVLSTSLHGRVLVLCFLAGSLLYRMKGAVPHNGLLAIASLVMAIVLFRFDYLVYIAPIFGAYITIWLGLCNPRRNFIVNTGDYSYGTYLYAGPIQQTCILLSGSANTYLLNVIMALPVTVVFALFSWHGVEKPFLRVKRWFQSEQRAVDS